MTFTKRLHVLTVVAILASLTMGISGCKSAVKKTGKAAAKATATTAKAGARATVGGAKAAGGAAAGTVTGSRRND